MNEPVPKVTQFTLRVHDMSIYDFLCYCFPRYSTTWFEVHNCDWESVYKKFIDESADFPYGAWCDKVKEAVWEVIYDAWHGEEKDALWLLQEAVHRRWKQLFEHVLRASFLNPTEAHELIQWCVVKDCAWALVLLSQVASTQNDLHELSLQRIVELAMIHDAQPAVLEELLEQENTWWFSALITTAVEHDRFPALYIIHRRMDALLMRLDTENTKEQHDTLWHNMTRSAHFCLRKVPEEIMAFLLEHFFMGHCTKEELQKLLPVAQERGFSRIAHRLEEALV